MTWKTDGLKVVESGHGIIAQCPTPQNGGVYECVANAGRIANLPKLEARNAALLEALKEAVTYIIKVNPSLDVSRLQSLMPDDAKYGIDANKERV